MNVNHLVKSRFVCFWELNTFFFLFSPVHYVFTPEASSTAATQRGKLLPDSSFLALCSLCASSCVEVMFCLLVYFFFPVPPPPTSPDWLLVVAALPLHSPLTPNSTPPTELQLHHRASSLYRPRCPLARPRNCFPNDQLCANNR